MKGKCKFIVFMFLLMVTIIAIDKYPIDKSKIVYELDSLTAYSTDSEISESLSEVDNVTVLTNFSYDRFTFEDRPGDEATFEEIENYRSRLRNAGKMYHSNKNRKLEKELNVSNYKQKYVSSYTPTIEYQFDKNEFMQNKDNILSNVTKNSNVDKVYIRGNDNKEANISDIISDSNATSYLASGQYTGSGIKVGILEPAVVDVNHTNMAGVNVTVYDNPWSLDLSNDHTTSMASIIAHQTAGIAPGVSIYSADAVYGLSDELDWFVDNGVHVVNMSYGEANPDGEYSSDSALVDYIAIMYFVTFVGAAGNDGEEDGYVGNPGLGYNVLTVGNYSGTGTIYLESSYLEVSGPEKPNLSVRGSAIIIPNLGCKTGTSISSAAMTGFVACLMQEKPALINFPDRTIALCMANSHQLPYYPNNTSNGLNLYSGAGLFDLAQASSKYYLMETYENNSFTFTNEVKVAEYTKYFSLGKTVSICCAWLAEATGDVDETRFTTYRMELYNSANQLIEEVSCGRSNYMMIPGIQITTQGNYKIKIYQTSLRQTRETEMVILAIGY